MTDSPKALSGAIRETGTSGPDRGGNTVMRCTVTECTGAGGAGGILG